MSKPNWIGLPPEELRERVEAADAAQLREIYADCRAYGWDPAGLLLTRVVARIFELEDAEEVPPAA